MSRRFASPDQLPLRLVENGDNDLERIVEARVAKRAEARIESTTEPEEALAAFTAEAQFKYTTNNGAITITRRNCVPAALTSLHPSKSVERGSSPRTLIRKSVKVRAGMPSASGERENPSPSSMGSCQSGMASPSLTMPASIVAKPPSADLWPGQTDEAEMGFTYAALEDYLLQGPHAVTPEVAKRIEQLRKVSDHKRALPPVAPV